jgi:hypothetical protein
MHCVWDSGIVDRAGHRVIGWLDYLIATDAPEGRYKPQDGSVEDWATESSWRLVRPIKTRDVPEDQVRGEAG